MDVTRLFPDTHRSEARRTVVLVCSSKAQVFRNHSEWTPSFISLSSPWIWRKFNLLSTMVSWNFPRTTRHSLHAFVCKGFFKVVDGLLRFSGRKPISESKCLLAAGERYDTSNISFLQRTGYVFADTNNSLRGTKRVFLDANNSFWGAKHVFRDANNSKLQNPEYNQLEQIQSAGMQLN